MEPSSGPYGVKNNKKIRYYVDKLLTFTRRWIILTTREGQPLWLRKKVVSNRFTVWRRPISTVSCLRSLYGRLTKGGQWTVKTFCEAAVLRHNGGFYNTPTLKRCLQRNVHFKTKATYNAHVSQLFPLQSRIVTKELYYFILSDQNKLVEIGCSHKKMFVKLFSILNR